MLKIVPSNRFKKDLKKAIKRNLDISLLDEVITKLANHKKLEKKYKDHDLKGEYVGFRECHIEPDWLLLYKIEKEELELFLFRTGTHGDIFK